jgi:hypothetical protein
LWALLVVLMGLWSWLKARADGGASELNLEDAPLSVLNRA